MTGFDFMGDPEVFQERMRRYLAGDKEAVIAEVEEERSGPSAEWDEEEFQEFLSDE